MSKSPSIALGVVKTDRILGEDLLKLRFYFGLNLGVEEIGGRMLGMLQGRFF